VSKFAASAGIVPSQQAKAPIPRCPYRGFRGSRSETSNVSPSRELDDFPIHQYAVWFLAITSSAEIGTGSGRGAQTLGNVKFCSQQSGARQLRQYLAEQIAGQCLKGRVGQRQRGHVLGGRSALRAVLGGPALEPLH
jgi:hypothetical protein